ncbi:uncharacterized protein HD556DRAFT_1535013 [Suillus plorans]|uniref:Uncharacterized protein n=1 Tax=Suillus plorans TaxID=116603 RepID=A0A9P7DLF7_9AGAM|nr:uncharacterized protein HD556DRAFT_1535013 [Suillus plorans]KAG1797735.1 hypothetical protein HD556DRAFT_1535013 [Suillus plorans]
MGCSVWLLRSHMMSVRRRGDGWMRLRDLILLTTMLTFLVVLWLLWAATSSLVGSIMGWIGGHTVTATYVHHRHYPTGSLITMIDILLMLLRSLPTTLRKLLILLASASKDQYTPTSVRYSPEIRRMTKYDLSEDSHVS